MKKLTKAMIDARAMCETIKNAEIYDGAYLLDYAIELGEARCALRDATTRSERLDDGDRILLLELDAAFCAARERLEKASCRTEVFPAAIGECIYTPRFMNVRIDRIVGEIEACELGFTEPTHYENEKYDVRGKVTGSNRMIFALVRKGVAAG